MPQGDYIEAQMKKTLAMHEESSTRCKVDDDVHEGAVPAYLMDRETTTRAKILSNTIKQKRKEKAGKWEVPLPKVQRMQIFIKTLTDVETEKHELKQKIRGLYMVATNWKMDYDIKKKSPLFILFFEFPYRKTL